MRLRRSGSQGLSIVAFLPASFWWRWGESLAARIANGLTNEHHSMHTAEHLDIGMFAHLMKAPLSSRTHLHVGAAGVPNRVN